MRSNLSKRYFELANKLLPALAEEDNHPVHENHCYGRIALDHQAGCMWRNKWQSPAYKTIPLEDLRDVVMRMELWLKEPSYLKADHIGSLSCRK